MTDFVEALVASTKRSMSPPVFRRWIGINMIAACLGRRVWTVILEAAGPLYPNLYTVLVAAPGIGKTIATENARDLLHRVKGLDLAPDRFTSAGLLLDWAEKSSDTGNCDTVVWVDELALLLQYKGEMDIRDTLTGFYNCPERFESLTVKHGRLEFRRVALNIMATTQPDWIAANLTLQDLGKGFASRVIWIGWPHAADTPEYFLPHPRKESRQNEIVNQLQLVANMTGHVGWHDDAKTLYNRLAKERFAPEPEDPNLFHYCTRRPAYMAKLSLIAAVSARLDKVGGIAPTDVETAMKWLHEAEQYMPFALAHLGGSAYTLVEQRVLNFLYKKGGMATEPSVLAIMSTSLPVHQIEPAVNLMLDKGLISIDEVAKARRMVRLIGG